MNRSALLAVPLVLTALTGAPAAAQDAPAERILSAKGAGRVELKPDGGTVSISVERRARTGDRARSAAARRTAAVVRGIRSEGVPRADISTEALNVRRVRRRDRPVRFVAQAVLRVDVDGLERLGRVIDGATRRGASDIFGPDLSVTPDRVRAGREQAEAEALEDARERAEAAAGQTGQRITGIQSIDLDPDEFNTFEDSAASGGGGADQTASRIVAGRQVFTATVRVTYLIEPAA